MTDNREALIEAMARAIIVCRFGQCRVTDWKSEATRNANIREALEEATAALSAIEAMGAVVVPVEATDHMIGSAGVALFKSDLATAMDMRAGTVATYAAMIAASPFAKGSTDDK